MAKYASVLFKSLFAALFFALFFAMYKNYLFAKKWVQLPISSRRNAIYKSPPSIGGSHFLLCQRTNIKKHVHHLFVFGLENDTLEINGDVTMHMDGQPSKHVNIVLLSQWTL